MIKVGQIKLSNPWQELQAIQVVPSAIIVIAPCREGDGVASIRCPQVGIIACPLTACADRRGCTSPPRS
jgi:hypothetical protein